VRFLLFTVSLAFFLTPSLMSGEDQNDATYKAMVERVKQGDFGVDFRALRLACMRASTCQPRSSPAELGRLDTPDLRRMVEVGQGLLDRGFVNLEIHATLTGAYQRLGDTAKSQYHLKVTTEMMRSILNSGDGKTIQTAFEVITVREEYSVLSSKGLPYFGPQVRSLTVKEGSHSYTRWDIKDPKTGQPVVVFFNIDAFAAKSILPTK